MYCSLLDIGLYGVGAFVFRFNASCLARKGKLQKRLGFQDDVYFSFSLSQIYAQLTYRYRRSTWDPKGEGAETSARKSRHTKSKFLILVVNPT